MGISAVKRFVKNWLLFSGGLFLSLEILLAGLAVVRGLRLGVESNFAAAIGLPCLVAGIAFAALLAVSDLLNRRFAIYPTLLHLAKGTIFCLSLLSALDGVIKLR